MATTATPTPRQARKYLLFRTPAPLPSPLVIRPRGRFLFSYVSTERLVEPCLEWYPFACNDAGIMIMTCTSSCMYQIILPQEAQMAIPVKSKDHVSISPAPQPQASTYYDNRAYYGQSAISIESGRFRYMCTIKCIHIHACHDDIILVTVLNMSNTAMVLIQMCQSKARANTFHLLRSATHVFTIWRQNS